MGCSSGVFSLDIAVSDSIAVSGHRDGSLKFWSIKDGKMMQEVKGVHDALVSSCQYMPGDANQVITSSRDQTVKVVDVRMFKVT
jgi:autophagy-related protein 16